MISYEIIRSRRRTLREMNHSKAFYRIVEEILPDYRECIRWLKENA